MASRLNNLLKTLTWNDFPRVNVPAPAPGQFIDLAQTKADIVHSGLGLDRLPGGGARIRDSIVVTIDFRRSQSWVANLVFTRPQSVQDDLLAHEQGHYNITALIGRDFFLELMRLKANTYPDANAVQADLTAAQENTVAKAQQAQDRYDADTQNGNDATQQSRWNGFISTAFTQSVSPPRSAPDGTSIKVPLLSVLGRAGINL
jgi:hypothetical protein